MAKRFGGAYSPDGAPNSDPNTVGPYAGAKRSRAGARTNLLFLAPMPLVITMWFGSSVDFAIEIAALGILLLSAWLTREGVLAQEAYDARTVARKPAIPRKIFGSALMGLGLGLAAATDTGFGAAIPAVIGAALHFVSFGPDPLRNKGIDGIDTFQQDRVARVVEDAEQTLQLMHAAVADLGDRVVVDRVQDFQRSARTLFRRVEEDPQDLTTSRKFLSVYLTGAKDAAQKFSGLYAKKRDAATKTEFIAFLDDLENSFAAKTDTLLANNKADLEIEMKVLRDRLSREGLPTETH